MEIFYGTLSLHVNPIKRTFFLRFKEFKPTFNYILNELDESIKNIEQESFSKDFSSLPDK